MRRRRAITVSSAAPRSIAVSIVGSIAVSMMVSIAVAAGGGRVDAGSDDSSGSKNSQLAEAQFEVYLLSQTNLVPTDVTCTLPPPRDEDGEMLCFALVSDRDTVAALATLQSPGVYAFTAINKVDLTASGSTVSAEPGTPGDTPQGSGPAAPQSDVDAAIIDTLDSAVSEAAGLGDVIREKNPAITSIDLFAFDTATSTLHIAVTTDGSDPAGRDAIAFSVTDIMAYLWETDEPLRDESATIRPRLEVSVDGVTYGTPYDVMVDVADYTITDAEWLEIVTGGAPYTLPAELNQKRLADHGIDEHVILRLPNDP